MEKRSCDANGGKTQSFDNSFHSLAPRIHLAKCKSLSRFASQDAVQGSLRKKRMWTKEEDQALMKGYKKFGPGKWHKIREGEEIQRTNMRSLYSSQTE